MANDLVPEGRKVLGLYLGNRLYYFSADAVVVNQVFTSIAKQAESDRAIAERLTELGYSHLVIRRDLFQQWLDRIDPHTRARVEDFLIHRLDELIIEKGYGLYEIKVPESGQTRG